MKINKVFCLFEQSGTFKNEFIKLGVSAEDYDILNDFGQTDHVIDLFSEIRGGYEGRKSIFDNMTEDDLIFAFFPCTRFEAKVPLWFRGENYAQRNWDDGRKLETSMRMHEELNELYVMLCKLVIVCINKGLRLVIENPYMQPHYLTNYWCIKPTIIDKDRRENGDYYEKPTQYWFIDCKPEDNLVFEPIEYVKQRIITRTKKGENTTIKTERSMIHPQYARRFIKQYILDGENT